MSDRILWEYLETLPEQETAWKEWHCRLASWHCFNTFYTHYLKVDGKRAKLLNCMKPCEHGCPRRIVGNSSADIAATCPQDEIEPLQLKFKDILIYSIRLESFHQALCASLNIKYSADRRKEYEHVRHLGGYSGTEVYLTFRTAPAILGDTISSLYLAQQQPFILIVPTVKNITPEVRQFFDKNNFTLFSMAENLRLQPDGSFKAVRGFAECIKSSNGHFQQ